MGGDFRMRVRRPHGNDSSRPEPALGMLARTTQFHGIVNSDTHYAPLMAVRAGSVPCRNWRSPVGHLGQWKGDLKASCVDSMRETRA